jgi:diguanylate cyclase (GGDEF)-like protein
MQRLDASRVLTNATIVAAAGMAVHAAATLPFVERTPLLLFGAVAVLASLVRTSTGRGIIRLETVASFPAILIFHSLSLGVLVATLGAITGLLIERRIGIRPALISVREESSSVIATFFSALLFISIIPEHGGTASKLSGYLVLMASYFIVDLVLHAGHLASPEDIFGIYSHWMRQARALLLLAPIVAIVVMLHASYASAGVIVGVLPLLLVAQIIRNESEAEGASRDAALAEKQLAILSRSSRLLFSAEGEEATVQRFVELLGDRLRLRAAAVVTWETLPDTRTDVYRFGGCALSDQSILAITRDHHLDDAPPARSVCYRNTNRPIPLSHDAQFQLVLGIQTAEVIYGVLIYESDDPEIEDEGVRALFELLTAQTALSLQDQLLRREMHLKAVQLQRSADTTQAAVDVARELFGEIELEPALQKIVDSIQQTLGFRHVVVSLFDEKEETFKPAVQAGLDGAWEKIRRRRALTLADTEDIFHPQLRISNSFRVPQAALSPTSFDIDQALPGESEWSPRDLLIVPLMVEDRAVGLLTVSDPADGKQPTLETVNYLELFASHAAGAIRSSEQIGEIRRLTNIDALTPAYNHRYFQEALSREVTRHERNRRNFALMMLDIDDFKRINDSFGHPIGDEILKGMVDEVVRNVREIDVVARYGGEEFAIILPDTNQDEALEVAERLRNRVGDRLFTTGSVRDLQVQVTIGVAVFPIDADTAPALVEKADAALYEGKKQGKNRVVFASVSRTFLPAERWE